jgi:hypothetical protein
MKGTCNAAQSTNNLPKKEKKKKRGKILRTQDNIFYDLRNINPKYQIS